MAEGVFENDWFLNVPRGTIFLQFAYRKVVSKLARLEKIPKYSPHARSARKVVEYLYCFLIFLLG